MGEPPETFDCTVTDWAHVDELSRAVSEAVRDAEFEPDVIVALARGGWIAGRICCDLLGIDDLVSLKIEHYVGTAQKGEKPRIRYPLPEATVGGKDVLIVDEIADTGETIERAREYVAARTDGAVRTATLQLTEGSASEPAFVGEVLAEWTWVIYPWNVVENLIDLSRGVLKRADGPLGESTVRDRIAADHGLDPAAPQLARVGEVLAEMVRRDEATRTDDGRWRLA